MSGEVPGTWAVKSVGEIAFITMGQSPPSSTVSDDGDGLPFIQGNAEFGARYPKPRQFAADCPKVVEGGDILLSVRAPVGEVNVAPERLCIGRGLAGLRPMDGDHDFLYYALGGLAPVFARLSQGSTFDAINGKDLRSIPLLVPPLDEQRRIAEVLRSVDEAIAAEQAALVANEAVHRLLLDTLFGICFSEKDSGKSATIGQVCKRVTYGFTNPMPTTDEGPWMLTAANVRHGWIDYNSARHTSSAAYSDDISDKSRPPVGSVLVTKDGTLGRVARVDRDDVCINQSVAVLIPNANEIDGRFLSYLLQCPTGQERMLADSGGSSVKHIYITKLAEMLFALPPMEVQRERATLAEESENAVREQANAVEALSGLKDHLMSDLLSGRVRVPA